jgi:hypothetical protein
MSTDTFKREMEDPVAGPPPKPDGQDPAPDTFRATGGETPKLGAFKPPPDAADMASLFIDTGLDDPLAETAYHSIPIGKPRDFFRVVPDLRYRQRCSIYTLKIEGQVEEQHYIVDEPMRGLVPEAKLCIVATCIYRNGAIRLWPLKVPREGEKDQAAWISARAAAREGMSKWVKLLWLGGQYQWRPAAPGYAEEPDCSKLPPYWQLIRLGFGEHGVMRDEGHPVYREHVLGAAKSQSGDGPDL